MFRLLADGSTLNVEEISSCRLSCIAIAGLVYIGEAVQVLELALVCKLKRYCAFEILEDAAS